MSSVHVVSPSLCLLVAGRVMENDGVSQEERQQRLQEALQMDRSYLSEEQQKQVELLVKEYSDIFALEESELGVTRVVTHTIDIGDHAPVRQQARCMPFALHHKVDTLVKEMMEQGVICPWASPVVLGLAQLSWFRKKMGVIGSAWTIGGSTLSPKWMFFRYRESTTPWICLRRPSTFQC